MDNRPWRRLECQFQAPGSWPWTPWWRPLWTHSRQLHLCIRLASVPSCPAVQPRSCNLWKGSRLQRKGIWRKCLSFLRLAWRTDSRHLRTQGSVLWRNQRWFRKMAGKRHKLRKCFIIIEQCFSMRVQGLSREVLDSASEIEFGSFVGCPSNYKVFSILCEKYDSVQLTFNSAGPFISCQSVVSR